ncbi:MAG TPA: LamG-like jellyroll fold domain-containing protein [Chloroflexia bacterium]|nr:LamG-like jellyroll fold domain-containing protein [Chloroflexia bacterium]
MHLSDSRFQFISSITHEGKVLVFGTDSDGKVYYTVKQDGYETNYGQGKTQLLGWEDAKLLDFPNETDDQSVVAKELAELTVESKDNSAAPNWIMRSRYATQNAAFPAPVQLISGLGHLYVFRQSKENTLLVDRFVLDGMENKLVRKLDVRYKRSRQKYQPLQQTQGNKLALSDSLDYSDANNNPFYEPTHELSFVKNLNAGRFSVALLPTDEHDLYRWHIFAHNSATGQVDLYSVLSSDDGLFDLRDTAAASPGIIKRSFELSAFSDTQDAIALTVINGPSATKYDVQIERDTQARNGDQPVRQLLRENTSVMVTIPTDQGVAVLNFEAGKDGSLAYIAPELPAPTLLRGNEKDLLLPLNALDNIKGLGEGVPPAQGTIEALLRTDDNKLAVKYPQNGNSPVNFGDTVKLDGTNGYNGHYVINPIDSNNFEIVVDQPVKQLGNWEVVPQDNTGLVFDGLIRAFEVNADGNIKVYCPNHSLEKGDEVQITGTSDYNQTFTVTDTATDQFTVNTGWQPGTALNLKMEARKRRGILFDGQDDYVDIPALKLSRVMGLASSGQTYSAWIYLSDTPKGEQGIISQNDQFMQLVMLNGQVALKAHLVNSDSDLSGKDLATVTGPNACPLQQWVHVAGSYYYDYQAETTTLTLFMNGQQVAQQNFSGSYPAPLLQNAADLMKWQPAFRIGSEMDSGYFAGKIAEAQIWSIARSAKEINNTMYLQLLGNETGLAGYWKLGAITEGSTRKVTDFSIYGYDGTVYGGAYVSARTLYPTLQDGTTKVVKFINDDLVAVTQGATYLETFEFRFTSNSDPNPQGSFDFDYMGKLSRSSNQVVTDFGDLAQSFTDQGNGWQLAACRFTVPDGVALIRAFGIKNLAGNWQTLEVRNQRIKLISGSISQAEVVEKAAIKILADQYVDTEDKLASLDKLEQLEARLLARKAELEKQLAAFTNLDDTRNKVNALTQEVNTLQAQVSSLKATADFERNNPTNFVLSMRVQALALGYLTYVNTSLYLSSDIGGLTWKFVDQGNGYYRLTNSAYGDSWAVDVDPGTKTPQFRAVGNYSGQFWKVTRQSDGSYRISNMYVGDGYSLTSNQNGQLYFGNGSGTPYMSWYLNPIGGYINNKYQVANDAYLAQQAILSDKQSRLAALQATLDGDTAMQQALQAELNRVTQRLNEVQTQLATANTDYLNAVNSLNTKPQSMDGLNLDSRGLKASGALLGFVRPVGPLTAIETSEGNVQLSYFDEKSRLRLTNYDATSDSANTTFEQWVPDAQRVCLRLDNTGSLVKLATSSSIPLGEDWTIEAWVAFPLNYSAPGSTNVVAIASQDLQNSPSPEVPLRFVWTDQDTLQVGSSTPDGNLACQYNLKQLAPGWHHIAAVGTGRDKDSTTLFYVDGKQIGDVKAEFLATVRKALANNPQALQDEVNKISALKLKAVSNIAAFGNSYDGTQHLGKLNEVRIWQVALSQEEIEVNSKTFLNGNEPGLRAYYRMNEGQGTDVRDATGQFNCVAQGATWWGCTADTYNTKVMTFDGTSNYLQVGGRQSLSLGNTKAFTLSAWVNPQAGGRIISKFNGAVSGEYKLSILPDGQVEFHRETPPWEMLSGTQNVVPFNQWSHVAATYDGQTMVIYINGVAVANQVRGAQYTDLNTPVLIGATLVNNAPAQFFKGQLTEVCIWNKALSAADLKAGMNQRVLGNEAGLVGYWPLDGGPVVNLADPNRESATVNGASFINTANLPLYQAVQAPDRRGTGVLTNEYVNYYSDPATGQKSAMMRRFLAYSAAGGVELLSGKRIEELDQIWIGNAQFNPTLLGFIEGAPPVPSENLTVSDSYAGATSVELTMSNDVSFSWNRDQEAGLGGSFSLFFGVDEEAFAGEIVAFQKIGGTHQGFKGDLAFNYSFLNSSSVSTTGSLNVTDRLELRGSQEPDIKFDKLGRRFIPKNVGYALVVSGLADVYVVRLKRSGKMVSYLVLPNDAIPLDVNTITFMINPAYTMNGSLDGLTGSSATSERFFPNVPEMRAQYGSLYPASYFRLQEAYDLKKQIDQQDKARESYFANFNSHLVDETSLNNQIGSNQPMTDQEKQDQQDAIKSRVQDQQAQVHALTSFDSWQRKMEDLQIKAGKRNIVNTYVWDADGGLRAESQSFANAVEHTVGGSFNLEAALGYEGENDILGLAFNLTAQATVHLTQTMTKTLSTSQGLSLNVDLSGVESSGVTDYNDNPLLPGEKVNRYRFMSFYLEGDTNHFNSFFQEVVDPEWLMGNSEEARALRQARGKANKTWRVLHRVTYVERPALQGFGQDTRPLNAPATQNQPDLNTVVSRLDQLESENQQLRNDLKTIIQLLSPKVTPSVTTITSAPAN